MDNNTLLEVTKELFVKEISETSFHYMKCQVNLYNDMQRDTRNIRLILVEIQLAYDFQISENFIYLKDYEMIRYIIKSHIFNFIKELNCKIKSPENTGVCTKELILEKYFDSYVYSKTSLEYVSYFEYVINNPNIILRRGAGHTRALVNFVNEPSYKSIVDDTLIVFNNLIKYREFNSYPINHRKVLNLGNSIDVLRGRSEKFIIFNSFQDCFRLIDQLALSGFYTHNTHFIILGE